MPWLVVWGPSIPAGLSATVLCVTQIPGVYKVTLFFFQKSLMTTAFYSKVICIVPLLTTLFLLLPTWFTALHLFSSLSPSSTCSLLPSYSSQSLAHTGTRDQVIRR